MTMSKSGVRSAKSGRSGSRSLQVSWRPGSASIAVSRPGSSIWPAVGNVVRVTSPWGALLKFSHRASARSSAIATSVAVLASARPAPVRFTPRPERSVRGIPASRSSTLSCCDTAETVRFVAAATAVMLPRSESSLSSSSRLTSM